MSREKGSGSIEKTKEDLLERYEKDLGEIFKHKNTGLTFDELEKLVDEKMDTARSDILQMLVEREQERKSAEGIEPEETCICVCGTEVRLCRDKGGNPKIFERTVQTKRGPVKIKESGYYCSKCRKIFFPSEKRAQVIQRKLQSRSFA